jgi:hypothetical protein
VSCAGHNALSMSTVMVQKPIRRRIARHGRAAF